jgi:prephenate dehydratase
MFLWYIFFLTNIARTCQVLVHVQLHLNQKSDTIKTKMLQDESPNVTRYLVLAKTANRPKEHGQYKVFFCYVSKIKYIFVSGVQ